MRQAVYTTSIQPGAPGSTWCAFTGKEGIMEHMDHRDLAALRGRWYKRLDDRRMTAIVEVYSDDGDTSEEVTVRVEWGVCQTCNGRGHHVNPSIDAGGLTAEDFAADPGFERDYRRGLFDVACAECKGQRVVPVPADDDPEAPRVWERMAEMAQSAREQAHAMAWGY